MHTYSALCLLAAAGMAQAAVTPLTPVGAPKVGSSLNIQWNPDTTGDWTNVQIDFMSGDNWNMIKLDTVATGIDATSDSSLKWTVPDVTIYSEIYFFQFTIGGDVSTATWTTRFPIAPVSGNTVAPPESIQPDGQTIGWGSGGLADGPEETSVISLSSGENNPGHASSTMASSSASDDEEESETDSSQHTVTSTREPHPSSTDGEEEKEEGDESTSLESDTTTSSSSITSDQDESTTDSDDSTTTANTEDEISQDDSSAVHLSVAGLALGLSAMGALQHLF